MKEDNKTSFWPSYVDIMTTLFAIMLVLFVVSFSRFKIKQRQLQVLVDEYENIINVYSTVSQIDSTSFFGYNDKYLKHLFTVNVEFQSKEFQMNKLKLDLTNPTEADLKRDSIVAAGHLVMNTIKGMEASDSLKNNIKFLVVIEGQSSKTSFYEGAWRNNYTLSYLRAQYLNEFWKQNGVDIDAIPRCELIIAGSGEGGHPRNVPDTEALKAKYTNQKDYWKAWLKEEEKNQRFLIHIVPVIGNIDVTKEKIDAIKKGN